MISNVTRVFIGLCLLFAVIPAASAQGCPDNAYLVRTVESGRIITDRCRCVSGFRKEGQKCVIKPDVIDPRWLAMPGQIERVKVRLDALALQRKFIENEMTKLKAIDGGMQLLWMENVVATRVLLQDAQSQTLDLLVGLLTMARLPSGLGRAAGAYLAFCQAYYYQYAYETAQDEQRARDKMKEAIGAFKNFMATNSSVINGKEAESIKAGTDSLLKIYKILDRQRQDGTVHLTRSDWDDAHGALIDMIQAVSRVDGGALKVVHAQSTLTFGVPFALRALVWDRAEIEKAHQSNRTALRYYEDRLAKIAEYEALYREGLRLER